MATPADLIRFLRDCYLADSRGGGVLDLFAKKIGHRSFLPAPEELLAGVLDLISVPRADWEPMATATRLYQRERSFLYGAFPLVGRSAAAEPTAKRAPSAAANSPVGKISAATSVSGR